MVLLVWGPHGGSKLGGHYHVSGSCDIQAKFRPRKGVVCVAGVKASQWTSLPLSASWGLKLTVPGRGLCRQQPEGHTPPLLHPWRLGAFKGFPCLTR